MGTKDKGQGGPTPPPLRPCKISHQKDDRRRCPYIFHVFGPSLLYPTTGSSTCVTSIDEQFVSQIIYTDSTNLFTTRIYYNRMRTARPGMGWVPGGV